MISPGYSGTPLGKKLGINNSQKILLINSPENYFGLIENDISKQFCRKGEKADLIHLFVTSNSEFEKEMKSVLKNINPTTIIWVSWYKKSSGIKTDVTEDTIRNFALSNGLVDVKVCAVTAQWSGLKLVVPLRSRK